MEKTDMKMMLVVSLPLLLGACASKSKTDNSAMLEKYPACYNMNQKIVKKCIEKNEAGEKTTAMELENTQYPGQYK